MSQLAFLGSKPIALSHSRASCASLCSNSPKRRTGTPVRALAQRETDPLVDNPLGPPAVVCVGEVLYDLFSANPMAAMSDRSQWSPSPGGGTANIAAGLAKLGTASAFIGNVGDDELGHQLISVLKEYNVNVDGMLKVPGKSTREVFVRRDETGERAFVGFGGVNDQFADACVLDPDSLPGVLFYAAQVLVTPTLSLAFPGSRQSLQELVELAKMCKLYIVVDVNWRPVFWDGMASESEARKTILDFVKNAHIVKVSVEEVEFLYGEPLARAAMERPRDVLRQLGGNVSGVIITAGSEGAAFAFDVGMEPTTGRIPARVPKERVVDTTGAGDSFLAGFLSEMLRVGGFASLSDADKVKAMALFGAEVASRVVTAPGSMKAIPTRDIVEATITGDPV